MFCRDFFFYEQVLLHIDIIKLQHFMMVKNDYNMTRIQEREITCL